MFCLACQDHQELLEHHQLDFPDRESILSWIGIHKLKLYIYILIIYYIMCQCESILKLAAALQTLLITK